MDLEGGDSPWGDVPSQSISSNDGESGNQNNLPSQSALASPQSPPARGIRTPRRFQAQKLEAVDDSSDPLGPLGDKSFPPIQEQGPIPPQKEPFAARNVRPTSSTSQSSSAAGLMESVDLDEDEARTRIRAPPPIQQPSSSGDGPKRQTQPSMTVEQAAKPTFHITVGDPHKVGDLTSSHIVYQVRTKTTSKAYVRPEFSVTRRYRDFLWIYNSLHGNNPGIVVPPPPEKQAVGRFESNFVESRRAALERMLNKIAAHPVLQHDADLKIFLESDTFNLDVKNKENREPDLGQSKGMFSSLGISVGGGSKFVEHDDWFHDRKIYLEALENQLKGLMKAVDTVVQQRKGLAEAASDFAMSLHALADVELSPTLSGPLEGLSEIQLRIRELYERQAQQDTLTLGITIDEYIRLIGSVKMAFNQRQKSFQSWHTAESELQKRRNAQDKLLRQGKSQQDRLNQANADVADAERKVHQARLLFEDMGKLMRNELERFEKRRWKTSNPAWRRSWRSAVEAQKELIELWETFLLQLDSDDDMNPFFNQPHSSESQHERTESGSASQATEPTSVQEGS
ncbi:conserved hypothetical protein [Uncinocarpus reesii 1704]|uniref:PX domain-containing protein n=1 Tax=Uncinocarpus reesii (strain UAMH 1704) TaxID=336963 RepID=C4JKS1_UNCRE|nr:uncharacterized protein UREG_00617 [Uncinocarpus reesii 1704]EEP75770.1 conserved hypothetical protein [Uncinocarpus reesii 1704]